ncbi:alpha/beta-hydrolase family protein [Paraburkholderia sp. MMS20-SJTN17]|uniref:Alpha/beta-hydrolase family protein n=1 Tax=Paraburkholderia translucens TaxID=2886945 RepID=A0ABS8KID9_9BURK|nr:alpha/beta-hydrolase family protein [Paraburkholderia sp. MMS20-SJTN17]MCC8404536.1 alpha/beta-hydrolase family protein [Paraburkholderia sp. MMS20-SJTN17]
MRNSHQPVAPELRGAFDQPAFSGSLLALLFWWESLTPTLIPRTWATQTVIGAICLAIGYGLGTLAGRGVHRLLARRGRLPGSEIRRRSWIVLAVVWLIALVLGSKLWLGWQNEQRSFMGMSSLVWLDGLLVGVLSPFAAALFVAAGRAVGRGVGAVKRFVQGHVPSIVSVPATALLIIVMGMALGRAVALPALTTFSNLVHAQRNEDTTEGTVPPESPAVSGSSGSFVAWDTLGRMGRDFVATVTTRRQLAMFHGTDVGLVDPVRVYVGVRSADSLEQRAQLVVRELERAGGFERKVLVVWVPTGTGWMVPNAVASLEQVYRGDTAIVAIQYSFLPSRLAIFMDAGLADEAGITLFNAVRARWSKLPPQRRPKLILFGKSLGAAGVEAPFVGADASASVANMVARTDGVLIAGAKQSNTIHSQITRERDPGSPFWQPVFDKGRSVRFLNRDPHQVQLEADWPFPRIVYLQHPADPAVFWSVEAFWRPPEWMTRPRGFDVPDAMRWFPIVSGVQAVGDLIHQLNVPQGFGHNYSLEDYTTGWVSVVPPEGWKEADTKRLARFLDRIPGDETEP